MSVVWFISAALPPHSESHTIRNAYFIRRLLDRGMVVHAFMPPTDSKDRSLFRLVDGAEIHTTGSPRYLRFVSRVGSLGIAKPFSWLLGIWSNLVVVPDMYVGWDRLVEEYARNPSRELPKPDVIVASSSTFTAHIAAARLASALSVPYVGDLGDPWTLNPIWPASSMLRRSRNRKLELRCVPKASALTVTTAETADLYRDWLGASCPPLRVVPMGFGLDEFSPDQWRVAGHGPSELHLAYIGVAYKKSRNLIPLFDAVIRVAATGRAVRLSIVGPVSRSFRLHVERSGTRAIEFVGPVSYSDSLEWMRKVDGLVAVGNQGTAQIPGKAYMYLASGRPILLIGQNSPDRDPTWNLLSRFKGTFWSTMDAAELERVVLEMHDKHRSDFGYASARLDDINLRRYEWKALAQEFADVVQGAVGRSVAS